MPTKAVPREARSPGKFSGVVWTRATAAAAAAAWPQATMLIDVLRCWIVWDCSHTLEFWTFAPSLPPGSVLHLLRAREGSRLKAEAANCGSRTEEREGGLGAAGRLCSQVSGDVTRHPSGSLKPSDDSGAGSHACEGTGGSESTWILDGSKGAAGDQGLPTLLNSATLFGCCRGAAVWASKLPAPRECRVCVLVLGGLSTRERHLSFHPRCGSGPGLYCLSSDSSSAAETGRFSL